MQCLPVYIFLSGVFDLARAFNVDAIQFIKFLFYGNALGITSKRALPSPRSL